MTEPLFVLRSQIGSSFSSVSKMLTTTEDVRVAFQYRAARWIAPDIAALELLKVASEPKNTWHRLLVLDRPSRGRMELLHSLFRIVVSPDEGVSLLKGEELRDVLESECPEDYFIGGIVDSEDRKVVLFRGNLERLLVPLSWFNNGERALAADSEDFEVIDSGQTLRFGRYEAAADAVLYEFDSEARRRMKERQLDHDESLGGSIRRLRLSRGLSQADFPGLDPKTISRIERGKIEKPQEATLKNLADRLAVSISELGSY